MRKTKCALVTNLKREYIPSMQTALHIQALVAELKETIVGGKIVRTEFYKKERSAFFFIKSDRSLNALGFVYHPAGAGCFLVPASKVMPTTNEKPWPVFALEESVVESVEQYANDRIFKINLSTDAGRRTLVVEAMGPNGNLWLLDENSCRLATLRKKTYDQKEAYAPPPQPEHLVDPNNIDDAKILEIAQECDRQITFVNALTRTLGGFNKTIVFELLRRSEINLDEDELDDASAIKLVADIKEIVSRFTTGPTGYLYERQSGVEVYPFRLKTIEQQPEKYKTLSFAVAAMTARRRAVVSETDERKVITSALKRSIKKLSRRVEHLGNDIVEAADFELFRINGELLKVNLNEFKRGDETVTLVNMYDASGGEVTIKLNPVLSPTDNVESYFKRYRKGREGLELLERRLEISKAELIRFEEIYAALDMNFDSASEQYREEIESLLPRISTKRDSQPRLPYREHQLSTGLTIFVGKDGADNDRTTFDFAKPYELWFHAGQCPGSHVVIKFPSKTFEPSKREIEETAAIAAFHSKARNDSLVSVIYTQRKYVRKPRKAKPGLVSVEREKSVMVAPKPAESK